MRDFEQVGEALGGVRAMRNHPEVAVSLDLEAARPNPACRHLQAAVVVLAFLRAGFERLDCGEAIGIGQQAAGVD